jgi:hypothetical protein
LKFLFGENDEMREEHVRVGVKGERQWRKEIGEGWLGTIEQNKEVGDLEGRK